jgi:hypothetical protein
MGRGGYGKGGGKLNLFIQSVEAQHLTVREEPAEYSVSPEQQ